MNDSRSQPRSAYEFVKLSQEQEQEQEHDDASCDSFSPYLHTHDPQPHSHCHGHDLDHAHSHEQSYHYIHDPLDPHSFASDLSLSPDDTLEAVHYCDVLFHFSRYLSHTMERFERLNKQFNGLEQSLMNTVPAYAAKQQIIRQCVVDNSRFITLLLSHSSIFYSPDLPPSIYSLIGQRMHEAAAVDEEKISKVRSTLRQCVRDWSKEGAGERDRCYGAVTRAVCKLFPNQQQRGQVRVLVPGSGLGRLVWDLSRCGFDSTGNEFSYYMLLCSYVILNETRAVNEHVIFPWVHDTRNVLNRSDPYRAVAFPDVAVGELPPTAGFSMVAGDFMEIFAPFGNEKDRRRRLAETPLLQETPNLKHFESFDCVASCYFLDCASNILEFIRTIAFILKPGGYWVNFGPLLYHYSDMEGEISIELTYEEVRSALPAFGLRLIEEAVEQPSTYTVDPLSMLQQQYKCVFFVVQKVANDSTWPPAVAQQLSAHKADAHDGEDKPWGNKQYEYGSEQQQQQHSQQQ